MNRTIALILFCCLVTRASAEDATAPKAEPPKRTATILPNQCVFTFPVADIDRQWRWGVDSAGTCEYQWMVTVESGGSTYQIGFSFFNPLAVPQSGSLAELLAAGQVDVWKLKAEGNSAKSVKGVQVTCESTSDGLRIVLEDMDWTRKLFLDKPSSVKFEESGSQLKSTTTDVKVVYEPAEEEE